MNYYNEFDPFAAEWLKELIKEGLIPNGDVDTRSIADVSPGDLRPYSQCHFFAGIGGWSHALRLAGWPDDRQIWTGSCPCQPFSVAGKGKGKSDERHLWPVFFRLISECRPAVVMGEQVAGKAGYDWFDGVAADLEGEGYASRAVDIPACAVDAPHIRQRLYWVATNMADAGYLCGRNWSQSDAAQFSPSARLSSSRSDMGNTSSERLEGFSIARNDGQGGDCEEIIKISGEGCCSINMADADGGGCSGRQEKQEWGQKQGIAAERFGGSDMADAEGVSKRKQDDNMRAEPRQDARVSFGGCGKRHSVWADAEWLTGSDGKARRAKSGVRLLVDGVPNRVGRLRGYGNAIVPPLAAEVIKAFMEVYSEPSRT